jgi:hypothetical protein
LLTSGVFVLLLIAFLGMELDGDQLKLPGYVVMAGMVIVIIGNLIALRWQRAGGVVLVLSAALLVVSTTINAFTLSADPAIVSSPGWSDLLLTLVLGYLFFVAPALATGVAHLLGSRYGHS